LGPGLLPLNSKKYIAFTYTGTDDLPSLQSPSSWFSAISHRSSYRMGGLQQKLKEATITYIYSCFQQQQKNATMGIYINKEIL
jgi:hypothetical protein